MKFKVTCLVLLITVSMFAEKIRNPFYFADDVEGYIEVPDEWVKNELD